MRTVMSGVGCEAGAAASDGPIVAVPLVTSGTGQAGLADCRLCGKRGTAAPGTEAPVKAVRFSQFGGPEVLEIVDIQIGRAHV